MKTSSLAVFILLLLVACPLVSLADTTSELKLISGLSTITILDNGAGDLDFLTDGTITYSNLNLNGWKISVTSGTTNSPDASPFGLDLASLVATCAPTKPCSTQPLQIWYSDINFSTPVGVNGFNTTFSSTQTGSGTANETAWFSNLDTLFSQQNLIGTVGPFSSSNFGSAVGGTVAANPLYSLTLEQIFTDANRGSVSFSVDGNIEMVTPEPSSLALMLIGVLLLSVVGLVRSRPPRRFRTTF